MPRGGLTFAQWFGHTRRMDAPENTPPSQRAPKTRHPRGPTPLHRTVAQLMVHEGKSFKQAAITAGYSPKTAGRGPADLADRSPSFGIALAEETRKLPNPQELLALSVNSLVADIRAGRSRGLEKTIETLGRFKLHDWFVRNSDTQLGVFLAFGEQTPETADQAETYKE